MTVPEAIRLIIWDLDETFWKGTLTEGGIDYVDAHHHMVIELTRRGIMNSICSKNDTEPVKQILEEKGLWDYFIFPSINWEPKGPRLAALVNAVQLRAPTIMFIDDNHLNRNEAVFFVPEMQVLAETALPMLLSDPRFKGKDDRALSRLAQYKLLEARSRNKVESSDNRAFLKSSNIMVEIDHNIEENLDRVVELINRTNQLNFTKKRLSEDMEVAKREITVRLAMWNTQAGLVSVRDRFGDYGYIGVYVMHSDGDGSELEHYCFSCRTLGMAVETWLYERLRKPKLKINGEVLTDLFAAHEEIDWINTSGDSSGALREQLAGRILVRGGCEMQCVSHYLALNAKEVVGEFNIVRDGLPIRLDHLAFLRYAFSGLSAEMLTEAEKLNYRSTDFRSVLASCPDNFDVCVFSLWVNANHATYAHTMLPLRVPYSLPWGDNSMDARDRSDLDLKSHKMHDAVMHGIDALREAYVWSRPSIAGFKDDLDYILANIPLRTTIFFVLAMEQVLDKEGVAISRPHFIAQNEVIATVAAKRPNVHLLKIDEFVSDPNEIMDGVHFDRMVYYRLYQEIASILKRDNENSQQVERAAAE
jgi:FkbH-like protein